MILWISILSFLFDGLLSLSIGGFIHPLFTIVSLVLIYPYFLGQDFRYMRYLALLGLLYDIAYSNTIFLHMFLFMLLGFIVLFFYYLFSDRIYTSLGISLILIITYRVMTFLFLVLFKSYCLHGIDLVHGIVSSIGINLFYCFIGYEITSHYSKKHHILKSR